MKRISWGAKHDVKNAYGPPIPTVTGYKYSSDNRTDIRVFKYEEGSWGVQVTTLRSGKANSVKAAKRLAAKIATEMEESK